MQKSNFFSKFFFFSFFFFLITLRTDAQTIISSTEILSRFEVPNIYTLEKDQINFYQNNPLDIPILDKLEFRTETDEFDFKRQEYLLRASFNSRKEKRGLQGLNNLNIQILEIESEIIESELLAEQFNYLANWYELEKEFPFIEQRKKILEDKQLIFQKMAASSLDIDINEFVETEEDLNKLKRRLFRIEAKQKTIAKVLNITPSSINSYSLSLEDWISVEMMERTIQSLSLDPDRHLDISLRQAQLSHSTSEYSLEEAKKKQIFDFVQVKYAGRDEEDLYKEFSIGAGIRIPLKSDRKINLNEIAAIRIENEYKVKRSMYTLSEKIDLAQHHFFNLLEEYKFVKSQTEESQLKKLYDKHTKSGDLHPLTILQMKESLLKNEEELNEIENKILIFYLQILEYTGNLTMKPHVNYLSETLESF